LQRIDIFFIKEQAPDMKHEGKIYKITIAPAANDRMYEHFEFSDLLYLIV